MLTLELPAIEPFTAIRSSATIYELLDRVYAAYIKEPTHPMMQQVLDFVREIYPVRIYGDTIALLEKRQQLKELYADY